MRKEPSWDVWQAFQAVMTTGSLSAAARQLRLSQVTVRGRIDSLEALLETALFVRSAAGLSPTDQARAMGAHLDAMKTTSEALVRMASAQLDSVAGTVRLSVSEFVGAMVLPSMLGRLRARHPGLSIELAPSNASIDLAAQQADLAVRMFPPKGDGLVARKVGTIRLGLYASREYVARRGAPAGLDDLVDHDLVGPAHSSTDSVLASRFHPSLAHAHYVLRTDSHVAALAAIRAGSSIGVVQRPLADADAGLVSVFPDLDFASIETFVVIHNDLRKLPRNRAVFDWLVEELTRYAR